MLAFDIGCFEGDTTEKLIKYYDKVICVDANPNMINIMNTKFKDNQSVVPILGCISNNKNATKFYISKELIWSSAIKEISTRLDDVDNTLYIKSLNINDIIQEYGCPYYLKCDIEGYDIILLEQLLQQSYRPKYISCESECIGNRDIKLNEDEDLKVLNALKELNYTKFILINQNDNFINDSIVKFNDEYDFANLDNHWIDYDNMKNLIRSIDRFKYHTYNFWFDILATN